MKKDLYEGEGGEDVEDEITEWMTDGCPMSSLNEGC